MSVSSNISNGSVPASIFSNSSRSNDSSSAGNYGGNSQPSYGLHTSLASSGADSFSTNHKLLKHSLSVPGNTSGGLELKLKGLVIPGSLRSATVKPNSSVGITLPTIVSNATSNSILALSKPKEVTPRIRQGSSGTSNHRSLKSRKSMPAPLPPQTTLQLEPPWMSSKSILPKYSPAFKKKNLELSKSLLQTNSTGSNRVSGASFRSASVTPPTPLSPSANFSIRTDALTTVSLANTVPGKSLQQQEVSAGDRVLSINGRTLKGMESTQPYSSSLPPKPIEMVVQANPPTMPASLMLNKDSIPLYPPPTPPNNECDKLIKVKEVQEKRETENKVGSEVMKRVDTWRRTDATTTLSLSNTVPKKSPQQQEISAEDRVLSINGRTLKGMESTQPYPPSLPPTTTATNMKNESFQFSLPHSKPVVPVLSETAKALGLKNGDGLKYSSIDRRSSTDIYSDTNKRPSLKSILKKRPSADCVLSSGLTKDPLKTASEQKESQPAVETSCGVERFRRNSRGFSGPNSLQTISSTLDSPSRPDNLLSETSLVNPNRVFSGKHVIGDNDVQEKFIASGTNCVSKVDTAPRAAASNIIPRESLKVSSAQTPRTTYSSPDSSDDDSSTTSNHRTSSEDSFSKADDSAYDTTSQSDSLDRSLSPEMRKPEHLSLQRIVLKNSINHSNGAGAAMNDSIGNSPDSVKNFSALNEKWEQPVVSSEQIKFDHQSNPSAHPYSPPLPPRPEEMVVQTNPPKMPASLMPKKNRNSFPPPPTPSDNEYDKLIEAKEVQDQKKKEIENEVGSEVMEKVDTSRQTDATATVSLANAVPRKSLQQQEISAGDRVLSINGRTLKGMESTQPYSSSLPPKPIEVVVQSNPPTMPASLVLKKNSIPLSSPPTPPDNECNKLIEAKEVQDQEKKEIENKVGSEVMKKVDTWRRTDPKTTLSLANAVPRKSLQQQEISANPSPVPSQAVKPTSTTTTKYSDTRSTNFTDIRQMFEKSSQPADNGNGATPSKIGIPVLEEVLSPQSPLAKPLEELRRSSSTKEYANDYRDANRQRISCESDTSIPENLGNGNGESTMYSRTRSTSSLRDSLHGSVSSLGSTTSLISPQELQQLIDEANQSLEGEAVSTLSGQMKNIQVVILHREYKSSGSIGITLAGGADCETKEHTVHKVITDSITDRDGRIKKGDRILSINGQILKGVTHKEALEIMKSPRPEVVIVLSSLNGSSSELTSSVSDHSRTSELPAQPRSSRLESILDEAATSPISLNPIPVSSSDSFSSDDEFITLTVELDKSVTGLGFILEGGKDSPLGDCPLRIKRIFKGGPADKEGSLMSGDEVITVNNQSVHGMARTEAWNFLKKLPEGLVVFQVRRKNVAQTASET